MRGTVRDALVQDLMTMDRRETVRELDAFLVDLYKVLSDYDLNRGDAHYLSVTPELQYLEEVAILSRERFLKIGRAPGTPPSTAGGK